MNQMRLIPITDTAIYKLCLEVYRQYKAQHEHHYNRELQKKQDDAEKYLKITVDEAENEVLVSFVLDRRDLNG